MESPSSSLTCLPHPLPRRTPMPREIALGGALVPDLLLILVLSLIPLWLIDRVSGRVGSVHPLAPPAVIPARILRWCLRRHRVAPLLIPLPTVLMVTPMKT